MPSHAFDREPAGRLRHPVRHPPRRIMRSHRSLPMTGRQQRGTPMGHPEPASGAKLAGRQEFFLTAPPRRTAGYRRGEWSRPLPAPILACVPRHQGLDPGAAPDCTLREAAGLADGGKGRSGSGRRLIMARHHGAARWHINPQTTETTSTPTQPLASSGVRPPRSEEGARG